MRKLLLAALIALAPLAASAQSLQINRSQTGPVGTIVTATDPSGNTGKVVLQGAMLTDSSGAEKGTAANPVITSAAAGSNGQVVGNVASAATDSGNPVKIGCVVNTPTLPTFTNGQRGDCQLDTRGSVRVLTVFSNGAPADGIATSNIASFAASNDAAMVTRPVITAGYIFNGSTYDRGFTCTQTAAVNVTAGNTTQIVGLSGSTVIRVCSVSVSMSAAGTATFLTGTGTNCGTPSTIMTAMTLATGTPWAQSAPAGGSLFRSTAGGEICVTAATGNVTGFITYAQY